VEEARWWARYNQRFCRDFESEREAEAGDFGVGMKERENPGQKDRDIIAVVEVCENDSLGRCLGRLRNEINF